MVDYIFLSISAKNLVKIQKITIFKENVMAQTFQCLLLSLWFLHFNLFRGEVPVTPAGA
jgi:hypothetical protein